MRKLKLLSLMILFNLFSLSLFSQTPSAPSNGIWAIIDTSYNIGTSTDGETKARITLQNTTPTLVTATQFRVFYDNNAFDSASVDLVVPSSNLYLKYLDDNANGHVTITVVYTGSDTTYNLSNGETFEITLNHVDSSTFQSLATIDNLEWIGGQSFPELASTSDGLDTTINLHNYGGNFVKPNFQFDLNFVNVTGTPSKNLPIALETKPKSGGSWSLFNTYISDLSGNVNIDEDIDTTFWDIRLAIQGDTINVGNIISVADAHLINDWVTTESTPTGFDYYTGDINGDNNITISDAYGVFGKIAGRINEWPNNVKNVKFFTQLEYDNIINNPSTNFTSTIPGVTNFTYEITDDTTATFYVMGTGDANSTGFNMARVTPIQITNPANTPYYIIDEQIQYDMITPTIEINLPGLSVNEGNLVSIPVKVLGNESISSMQLGLIYDQSLLEFKEVISDGEVMNWITFINTNENIIEWGGYDISNGENYLTNDEKAFTINFIAKKPQDEWGISPLYTTRKFAGNRFYEDMNLTATNGVVEVKMIQSGNFSNVNELIIYPNPTSDLAFMRFNVEVSGDVDLVIRSIDGRMVSEVVNGYMPSGTYTYSSNLESLADGIYFASIITPSEVKYAKIVIIH